MSGVMRHYIAGDDTPPPEAGAFDLASAVWDENKTSVLPASSAQPNGCFYKDDGSEFYISDNSTGEITGRDLATPFTPPGGTLGANSNVGAIPADDFFISSDGIHMMVSRANDFDTYDMSTPWDLSTAVQVSSIGIANFGNAAIAIDGTAFYRLAQSTGDIIKYTLTTPWMAATAVITGLTFATGLTGLLGISISNDETRIYVVSNSLDSVLEYIMSTPGDPSTCVLNYTLPVGLPMVASAVSGIAFSPDQTKMLICGANSIPNGGGCVASFTGNAV